MTKIAGPFSQRHGSADPDPDPRQNVMDSEHKIQKYRYFHNLSLYALAGCVWVSVCLVNNQPHLNQQRIIAKAAEVYRLVLAYRSFLYLKGQFWNENY
jgi:hypothetical protein